MEIINLKENKEYINKAIESIKDYHNQNFISDNDNTLNYCLIDDNKIIGEIDYNIAYDSSDILFCYIIKEYRGMGLSKILLKETLHKLSEKNIKEVFLEVRVSNIVAYNLYKTIGFIEVGRRKKYYSNNEDAILMRIDL